MTRSESAAIKARATSRQRLLARLPSTTAALPHAQHLTRVSVNEVAREDSTVDITLSIRVTGDISALDVTFTINNWSEVPRG